MIRLVSEVNGQLTELGGPLYAASGGLVVPGQPAWLPAPPAAAHPSAPQAGSDQTAKGELASQLPGFFQAFAGSDQAALGRYLVPGTALSGLGGAASFDGITSLQVPPGGAARDITVGVHWAVPGQVSTGTPRLSTTHDMSVVDQQSGRWYVKDIRASTQPTGTS